MHSLCVCVCYLQWIQTNALPLRRGSQEHGAHAEPRAQSRKGVLDSF